MLKLIINKHVIYHWILLKETYKMYISEYFYKKQKKDVHFKWHLKFKKSTLFFNKDIFFKKCIFFRLQSEIMDQRTNSSDIVVRR